MGNSLWVVRSLVLFHHHKFSQPPTSKSIRGKRKHELGKEDIYVSLQKRAIKSIQRHLLQKPLK